MRTITIDTEKCIECGKCVAICPSHIYRKGKNKAIQITNLPYCIDCGHCVAICPKDAITHSAFPPQKIRSLDFSKRPTPEQVLELCEGRRSNRIFSTQPVPEESLSLILRAAHAAPTAENRQLVEFTLVTDPKKILEISTYTIAVFDRIMKILTNPIIKTCLKPFASDLYKMIPEFTAMKRKFEKGQDEILRGAKALLFIHSKKNRFGAADANLAYQNASLMAESLQIAHFYTGFVLAAQENDLHKDKLAQLLGIEGKVYAGMALGMPKLHFEKIIYKKDIVVNRI